MNKILFPFFLLYFFFAFPIAGDIVKRGCLEDLVAGEIQMCRREGTECKTCIGNNCNLKTRFQSCHTCNSDTNLNCVSLTNTSSLPTTTCRNYLDECKTVTVLNGRTERGCASQLTVTDESISYQCADDNCNANFFPPNRISCHQCYGSECSRDLSSITQYVETCRNYDVNDRCYAFVDGKHKWNHRNGSLTANAFFIIFRITRNASRLCFG